MLQVYLGKLQSLDRPQLRTSQLKGLECPGPQPGLHTCLIDQLHFFLASLAEQGATIEVHTQTTSSGFPNSRPEGDKQGVTAILPTQKPMHDWPLTK
jgi:hypothetical protein